MLLYRNGDVGMLRDSNLRISLSHAADDPHHPHLVVALVDGTGRASSVDDVVLPTSSVHASRAVVHFGQRGRDGLLQDTVIVWLDRLAHDVMELQLFAVASLSASATLPTTLGLHVRDETDEVEHVGLTAEVRRGSTSVLLGRLSRVEGGWKLLPAQQHLALGILGVTSAVGVEVQTGVTLLDGSERAAALRRIEMGELPRLTTDIMFGFNEWVHATATATYEQPTEGGVQRTTGRLVVTNLGLGLFGCEASWEAGWKRILSVTHRHDRLVLETTTGVGAGAYLVPEPVWLSAVARGAMRVNKRMSLASPVTEDNRYIPQDVRVEVWQRDGGACVECGSRESLTLDHIIPVALGGTSKLASNIQVLCMDCNTRKGDRL